MKSHHSLVWLLQRESQCKHFTSVKSHDLALTNQSVYTHMITQGHKLTVNRGVSFLMSSRETSIPMTPRINWFWCWNQEWDGRSETSSMFMWSCNCWLHFIFSANIFNYCTSPFLSSLVFVLLKTGSVPVMTRPSSWWKVKQVHCSTQESYQGQINRTDRIFPLFII